MVQCRSDDHRDTQPSDSEFSPPLSVKTVGLETEKNRKMSGQRELRTWGVCVCVKWA